MPFTPSHRSFSEQTSQWPGRRPVELSSETMVALGLAPLVRFLPDQYRILASLVTVRNIDIILVVSGRTHCKLPLGDTLTGKSLPRNYYEAASSVCLYTPNISGSLFRRSPTATDIN